MLPVSPIESSFVYACCSAEGCVIGGGVVGVESSFVYACCSEGCIKMISNRLAILFQGINALNFSEVPFLEP